jgi:hypothetical protein
MNFASPAFLAALGLLLPVVAAFLVKQRRRIVRVSSTLLWRSAARKAGEAKFIAHPRRARGPDAWPG